MINSRLLRFFSILLILLFSFHLCDAQVRPYRLKLKKDAILFGVGAALQATSFVLQNGVETISDDELERLNREDVLRFDRIAISYSSLTAQRISDALLFSSILTPYLYLTHKRGRRGFLEIGVLSTEALLLTTSLTLMSKVAFQRIRPLAYNPDFPIFEQRGTNARLSFFSGHTSTVAVYSFFGAKVFSDYFPNSKWKPVVWSAAVIAPALTGYLRVRGGKHFPTDTIVGYAVGAAVGYLIPHIHRPKAEESRVSFDVSGGVGGVGLVMKW